MNESKNLIIAVQKHPCLWDINHEDYHSRDAKEMAWEEVCKEVVPDWDSSTDQLSIHGEIKRKWTNIRDYYRKNMKNPPSYNCGKNKSYVYADMLNFLNPILDPKFRMKRIDKSDFNYLSDDADNTQPEMDIEVVEASVKQTPPRLPPPQKREKKDPLISPQTHTTQERDRNIPNKNNEEDDDTKFLLSFRTYMRKMNEDQKIDFKICMLQLVKKVNRDKYSSPPATPYFDDDS